MRGEEDMASFEDVFSDAQMGMVSVALEYGGDAVSDVFVQFMILDGMRHGDVFFVKDGKTYHRHELPGVDPSIDRQQILQKVITDEAQRIVVAGREYGRTVPVEGYLHYRVGGSVDARYSYEDIPADKDPQWSEKLEAWMQLVQQDFDKA